MKKLNGRYRLELNYLGDNKVKLNFWDQINGNDVKAEIKDGKIFHEENEISFDQFLEKVEESISLQK